ncbi:hypothetical protein [Chitinophaga sp. S165]|uniref:hypothetical protein n=1 Tax=Chitinophaga sp. S165 TaxID=2135462 RepID=UPI000D711B53|nr:hypothetical protein [Chitinophaga sp. S165]PWV55752.1 hypothetical protein C7475_101259 [Chitinophaga sp. S165]
MSKEIIDKINSITKGLHFFEFSVLSYKKGILEIAGSKDMIYYRNIKIIFRDVYAIIGTLEWKIIPDELCVDVIPYEDAKDLTSGYWFYSDLSVFKFNCDDTLPTYIIAKTIELEEQLLAQYELE